jgi:alpha-mannosidase
MHRQLLLERTRRMLRILTWITLTAIQIPCPVVAQQIGVTYSAKDQTQDALKRLSPQSQEVIERLAHIGALQLGDVRYFAGQNANGASVSLDDSNWQTIQLPYKASTDPVWLRKWIEIPKTIDGYDPTGARIWLREPTRGNVVVYLDGKRVARGEDMEPLVLFNSAKPGDKVLLAIEIDKSSKPRNLRGMELNMDFPAGRPDPRDLHDEFISTTLLLPALAPDLTSARQALEQAITSVDLKALAAANQKDFDASLLKAQSTLNELKPAMQKATLHLTGNSHIDAAWLWPWTETVDVVHRTFGTAAQLMDEYPTYTFTQSAAQYNEWMAEKYPPLNATIKRRIHEGRWEVVGGMWVEPDLNMPDGESLARQLLIGKRTFKQLYDVDIRIGWNPDSFGYNWQLPQIYKKSGIDYFVTQKMSWNETNQLPFKLFWWQSPDGSKVLAYFPDGYGNTNFTSNRLSNDLAHTAALNPGLTNMLDLYGVGDHGGGPTRALLDEGLKRMQNDEVYPKMKFGTAQAYFNEVKPQIWDNSPVWNYRDVAAGKAHLSTPPAGKVAIPTWNDELYLEFHRGVFTTQDNHKRNMRESEERVLNAEKYASLAWLNGDAYPAGELTDGWKKVLFNQFHDLAAGSGIGVIYKDAQSEYDEVRMATGEISTKALNTISELADTRDSIAGSVSLMIFNPLGWERSGWLEADVQMPVPTTDISVLDSNGKTLPSEVLSQSRDTHTYHLRIQTKNIPSLGYEIVHVVPGKHAFESDLKVSGTTLENTRLKIAVDPQSGCITSLYDKQSKFESLAPNSCGNQLVTFRDMPKMFDAWNIDADFEKDTTKLDKAASVEVVEQNKTRAVIRVTHNWQSSKFVQDIVLYDGADEVDVVNEIDWHEKHTLLKAAFDLAASSPEATYEIPYGTIERPTTRNNSWEAAKFEVPAIRWADLGDGQHGFSLINESKYGYDAKDHTLRLSLLRSPTDPDPDADQGHHRFSYALYPHTGDWKQALTMRHGYEYNYRLVSTRVEAHAGSLPARNSFVHSDAKNIVITAVKKAEDSNSIILRFYEWAGKDGAVRIQIPKGATAAELTNLLEDEHGAAIPIDRDAIDVPAHPYEIVTVKIGYPVSAK